jgi:hypothetical protein
MTTWAEREVELACKNENPNWDGKSFDYGCACYQSALKAYKSLMADNHSGASFGFTKQILVRLMNHQPLMPIEERDFNGVEPIDIDEKMHRKMYQCPRMGSLFKTVYDDGRVEYHDIDRIACCNIDRNYISHCGLLSDIVEKMYPITMPYNPTSQPYKIYFKDFLVDPKNGDYDTLAALYLITPNGERVDINKYWTEKDGELVEISKEEYDKLYEAYNKVPNNI